MHFGIARGQTKLLLYNNVIDIHIFHVFARSFLQNLINIYKECLLFRRVDVRYMSVGIEIVFTELWPSLLMENRQYHAYPVFRAMCNEMIAAYPKVFEAYQFSSKTIKEHLKKSSNKYQRKLRSNT